MNSISLSAAATASLGAVGKAIVTEICAYRAGGTRPNGGQDQDWERGGRLRRCPGRTPLRPGDQPRGSALVRAKPAVQVASEAAGFVAERSERVLSRLQVEPMAKARDRILDVARYLFSEEGLARVSTNRIGAELGIDPGNLHHHFQIQGRHGRLAVEASG